MWMEPLTPHSYMQLVKDMLEQSFDAFGDLVDQQMQLINKLKKKVSETNSTLRGITKAMEDFATDATEMRSDMSSIKEYIMPATNLPELDKNTNTYKLLDTYEFPVKDVAVLLQIEKKLREESRIHKNLTDCPLYMMIVRNCNLFLHGTTTKILNNAPIHSPNISASFISRSTSTRLLALHSKGARTCRRRFSTRCSTRRSFRPIWCGRTSWANHAAC